VGLGLGVGYGGRGGDEQCGIINARSPVIATIKLPTAVRIPGSVVQKDCFLGSGVGSPFIGRNEIWMEFLRRNCAQLLAFLEAQTISKPNYRIADFTVSDPPH
jgi:hypothetical protein